MKKAQEYWEKVKSELGVDSLTFELLFEDTDSIKNVPSSFNQNYKPTYQV